MPPKNESTNKKETESSYSDFWSNLINAKASILRKAHAVVQWKPVFSPSVKNWIQISGIRENLPNENLPKIHSGTICRIIFGKLSSTFGKLGFDKLSRKRFLFLRSVQNRLGSSNLIWGHIRCMHIRPHRRKDQLQLRSLRDLPSR